MARRDLFDVLASAATAGVVQPIALQQGWPSLASVDIGDGVRAQLALHLSTVGSHARKPHEFRFQNPASRQQVEAPVGYAPLLVGVWQPPFAAPLFVIVDGSTRAGRNTRFSILFNRGILEEATSVGWATYVSENGEKIVALSAEYFPIYAAAITSANGDAQALYELTEDVKSKLNPEDHAPPATPAEKERRRVSAMRAVRAGAFSSRVLTAYRRRCSMCGLGDPMLQAAHVHPVSAPDSVDLVSNGLAMCANHHLLFDAHLLTVEAGSNRVLRSPRLMAMAAEDQLLSGFLDSTANVLASPILGAELDEEMVRRRQAYYAVHYDWLGD